MLECGGDDLWARRAYPYSENHADSQEYTGRPITCRPIRTISVPGVGREGMVVL